MTQQSSDSHPEKKTKLPERRKTDEQQSQETTENDISEVFLKTERAEKRGSLDALHNTTKEETERTIEDEWHGPEETKKRSKKIKLLIGISIFLFPLLFIKAIIFISQPEHLGNEMSEKSLRTDPIEQMVTDAEKAAKNYLTADNIDTLKKFVLNVDINSPLIDKYYATRTYEARGFEKITNIQLETVDEKELIILNCKTATRETALIVTKNADGQYKVDWQTDVCYQPLPWEEFINNRSQDTETFRVAARIKPHHYGDFKDSKTYVCLELKAPKSDQILYGYFFRGSNIHKKLAKVFSSRGKDDLSQKSLTLKIQFHDQNSEDPYVIIKDVVSLHWFKPY